MASRPEDTIPSLLFSPPRCEKQGLHTGSSRSRRFPKQASFSPLKFAEPGRKKKKKTRGEPSQNDPAWAAVPPCVGCLDAPPLCGRASRHPTRVDGEGSPRSDACFFRGARAAFLTRRKDPGKIFFRLVKQCALVRIEQARVNCSVANELTFASVVLSSATDASSAHRAARPARCPGYFTE